MLFSRTSLTAGSCMLALCGVTALVQAAGFQFLDVPADSRGPALRGAVWSPCSAPAGQVALGRTVLPVVQDCPVSVTGAGLVVISHGSGGSFLSHHDTAEYLADAGFVVAAISHPGDNFQDLGRQAGLAAFVTRPVDIQRLVDYMTMRWPGRAGLDVRRVGFFGFSRGGYTGLVMAGAVPSFGARRPSTDRRIKAAVIADPLNLFRPAGLAPVRVPVQLWSSEYGGDGVTPGSVAAVRQGLPARTRYHMAEGAGHFSFLAPCSAVQRQTVPGICKDPAGFDREAFHADFNAGVVAFFKATLQAGADRLPADLPGAQRCEDVTGGGSCCSRPTSRDAETPDRGPGNP